MVRERGATTARVLAVFCTVIFTAALIGQGFGVFPPGGGSGSGLPSGCTGSTGSITCDSGFVAGDGTASSGIEYPELTTNGTSKIGWFAPSSLAASYCHFFPPADSASGQFLVDTGSTSMNTQGDTCTETAWSSLAPTATALAANGTNCSAGNYPLGVDASGNAESCTAAGGGSGFDPTSTANSLLSEDFYPGSAWSTGMNGGSTNIRIDTAGGVSGSVATVDGSANHPGVVQCSTGTTTARGCSFHYAYSAGYNTFAPASHTWEMQATFKFNSTMTGQDVYFGWIPGSAVVSTTPTQGIWIRKLTGDTNWQFVCDDSSVTTTDSGVAPVADTWYTLKIYSTVAGTVKYRVWSAGSALGSEVTISTNVPTANLAPALLHTGDGTSRVLALDLFRVFVTGLVR